MFNKSNTILLHWSFFKKVQNNDSSSKKKITRNTLSFTDKKLLSLGFILTSAIALAQTTTTTRTFEYTGSTQTFTVPSGVSSMTVEAWGAGGAGGGGNTYLARGAGGGGAYTKFPLSVSGGQVYTINVGAGGLGTSNPGGTGGASNITLDGIVKINAAGGNGGSSGSGGAGGLASAGIPTSGTNLNRKSGGNGGSGSGSGGGGGGSAGTGGNGGNGGNGANSILGILFSNAGPGGTAGLGTGGNAGAKGGAGGQASLVGALLFGGSPGENGNNPGAGGGGRSGSTSTASLNGGNGGNGGNGKIIITYTISTSDLSITKTVSNANPAIGDAVTFTITAKNERAFPVADIIVTDLLPTGYTFLSASLSGYDKSTGKWKIGSLASNATTVLTITGLINTTGEYNNTATILSETMPDDVPGNNSATAFVNVCKAGITAPQVNP